MVISSHFQKLTMAIHGSLLFSNMFFIFIATLSVSCSASASDEIEEREVHIVYMGSVPEGEYSLSSHHLNILQNVMDRSSVANSFVRSYNRSFNGFAAKLNTHEAHKLAGMKEVVSVFHSTTFQLHTTRSWDFMGFTKKVKRKISAESDIIVGVIDSGIWPESESFSDQGFGPAPKKWKGACEGGTNFTCNNKIIGARYYVEIPTGYMSARDDIGHGSHTASIAAGNNVKGASFYGLAQGTARGGVPSARIAVYKVCHPNRGCDSADVLAAFDDAIADGVDLITVSLGSDFVVNFQDDVLAIGAFHAMKKGILTIQSAGNSGCNAGSVASLAPWILTVGASSTDRKFIDKVVLGNGKTLVGKSVNSFTLNGTTFPLLYGRDVSRQCDETDALLCARGCVDSNLVKGKIVVCERFDGLIEAYKAGAMGAIVPNEVDDFSSVFPLPASALSTSDFYSVLEDYANSTKNPEASILKSEVVKDSTAPVVASFSSCGPNIIVPIILKPDVVAPGINILAAYSPIASPSSDPFDRRQVKHNIVSGTSMSCPHAAAVAAYVKTFHPDWSPSAIKSAIMTTAWPIKSSHSAFVDYSYGSGHINPVKAISPGLVFDADEEDYTKLLCDMGFDVASIRLISGSRSTCGDIDKDTSIDFNYPAISFQVSPLVSFRFKFHRTVTNVGPSKSIYTAKIIQNANITVDVQPRVLSFNSSHEKKSFNVTVEGQGLSNIFYTFSKVPSASLVWSDGIHSVRVPILAFAAFPDDF